MVFIAHKIFEIKDIKEKKVTCVEDMLEKTPRSTGLSGYFMSKLFELALPRPSPLFTMMHFAHNIQCTNTYLHYLPKLKLVMGSGLNA